MRQTRYQLDVECSCTYYLVSMLRPKLDQMRVNPRASANKSWVACRDGQKPLMAEGIDILLVFHGSTYQICPHLLATQSLDICV